MVLRRFKLTDMKAHISNLRPQLAIKQDHRPNVTLYPAFTALTI
jgi:hypothetical protein